MDRDQLETFATVVEARSFERAAALLNVSRGAVSQRIRALEQSLSSVLLVRDTPVVPTARGELLLRHVHALRLMEDSTLAALMPVEGRAPVQIAIAVNADSLATWFPSVLWALLRDHRLAIEVVVDDQDHTLQRLARGEVTGCISTRANPATGFVAEPLGCMEYRCYAARVLAQRCFPKGFTVHGALQAPAVLFDRKDSLHDEFLSALLGFRLERYNRHYLPSPQALLDGIAQGIGYGVVPCAQVVGPLADALVDLAPQHPLQVELYWHHWSAEPPQSRTITDQVLQEAGRALGPVNTRGHGCSRQIETASDAPACRPV